MAGQNEIKRILVIGGGIGGLAAGAALAQRGFEVQIAERRPAFEVHGVGLGQPANALRALRALGVLEECLEAGYEFDHFKIYDHERNLIVDHEFLFGDERTPAAAALPRADIHRILLAAAQRAGATMRLGTQPQSLAQDEQGVEVEFAGGGGDRYDLVVGFDGVRSSMRRQLFGETYEPVYSGFAAWRVIVERPPEVTCMEFYQGLGSKTGVMPLTEGTMYLFNIRPEPGNPWQDPDRFLESFRQRLGGYGGIAAQVRDRLTERDEITYSPLDRLLVEAPWHRGRVAIGGDAAHTYPPHMTQGAAMALEDAVVIAQQLAGEGSVEERLTGYVGRRLARCRYVFRFASRMLEDEQRIRTAADLEAARRGGLGDLDRRLDEADRTMNEDVLRLSPAGARRG